MEKKAVGKLLFALELESMVQIGDFTKAYRRRARIHQQACQHLDGIVWLLWIDCPYFPTRNSARDRADATQLWTSLNSPCRQKERNKRMRLGAGFELISGAPPPWFESSLHNLSLLSCKRRLKGIHRINSAPGPQETQLQPTYLQSAVGSPEAAGECMRVWVKVLRRR